MAQLEPSRSAAPPSSGLGRLLRERERIADEWSRRTAAAPALPAALSRERVAQVLEALLAALEGGDPTLARLSLAPLDEELEQELDVERVVREHGRLRRLLYDLWNVEVRQPLDPAEVALVDAALDELVVAALASSRDLAEKERLEEERARALALLDTLLETAPIAFGFVDRELRYVHLNRALAALNDVPLEEHIGRTVLDVLKERAPPAEAVLRRVLETGEALTGIEITMADGERAERRWLASYYPVRRAGELLGVGAVLVDVTESKRREEALEVEASLRERFIAILGHDLRNPLSAISLSAQLLLGHDELPAELARVARRILNSTGRMEALIDDVLEFTRSRLGERLALKQELLDVAELVRWVVDELVVVHPERVIAVEVQGATTAWLDRGRIEQVLSNLLSNALKHGARDGPVQVRLRGTERQLTLSVHNEGKPIARELLPRVFDPFRRGDGDAPHTGDTSLGLGLYIVSEIVKAHGGDVDVTSTSEAGTTFTVRLPRARL